MASTVPAKSQSLHNFALPRLKWNNNHPRGGRGGGGGVGGGDGGGEGGDYKRHAKKVLESHDRKVEKSEKLRVVQLDHGVDISSRDKKGNDKDAKKLSESHDRKVEKSEKSRVVQWDHGVDIGSRDNKGNDKDPRSRILIKIPASMRNLGSSKVKEEEKEEKEEKEKEKEKEEKEEKEKEEKEKEKEEKEENQVMMEEQRAWNLRPRRLAKKRLNGDDGGGGGGGLKGGVKGGVGGSVVEKKKDQLQKGDLEKGNRSRVEKEKNVKFSLSLTRQEIEEDVYSFTGLKASRRPSKRPKAIQKNLDNLFPGQYLGSITPDSYKVSEHTMKG